MYHIYKHNTIIDHTLNLSSVIIITRLTGVARTNTRAYFSPFLFSPFLERQVFSVSFPFSNFLNSMHMQRLKTALLRLGNGLGHDNCISLEFFLLRHDNEPPTTIITRRTQVFSSKGDAPTRASGWPATANFATNFHSLSLDTGRARLRLTNGGHL